MTEPKPVHVGETGLPPNHRSFNISALTVDDAIAAVRAAKNPSQKAQTLGALVDSLHTFGWPKSEPEMR